MRVKNTIFTALAAGVIFLSGMVILGKSSLMKQNQDRLNTYQSDVAVKVVGQAHEKGRLPDEMEVLFWNMVNKLFDQVSGDKVGRYAEHVSNLEHKHERFTIKEVKGLLVAYGDKEAYRIREPSGGTDKNNYKVERSDKGG